MNEWILWLSIPAGVIWVAIVFKNAKRMWYKRKKITEKLEHIQQMAAKHKSEGISEERSLFPIKFIFYPILIFIVFPFSILFGFCYYLLFASIPVLLYVIYQDMTPFSMSSLLSNSGLKTLILILILITLKRIYSKCNEIDRSIRNPSGYQSVMLNYFGVSEISPDGNESVKTIEKYFDQSIFDRKAWSSIFEGFNHKFEEIFIKFLVYEIADLDFKARLDLKPARNGEPYTFHDEIREIVREEIGKKGDQGEL